MTLEEQIEQVRLDFVKFYKDGEWLSAYQSWKTYNGLKNMKTDVREISFEFPELEG